MSHDFAYDLPDWAPLVLASAKGELRGHLRPLLGLHHFLARALSAAKEPTLFQIRLAWWRQELSREQQAEDPPPPDPLLADLRESWQADTGHLLSFLDGWEGLLGERPVQQPSSNAYVTAYANCFALMAGPNEAVDAAAHGACWAKAELTLASFISPTAETATLPRLSKRLRAIAIIGGLARRSLGPPVKPMMGDRFSPIVALRLSFLGI